MPAIKRKFRKLKGVSKECDEFALMNDRRPFTFGMTFGDGGTLFIEGSVAKDDVHKLKDIFRQLQKIASQGKQQ